MRTALPAPRVSSHRLARYGRAIAAGARVLCAGAPAAGSAEPSAISTTGCSPTSA